MARKTQTKLTFEVEIVLPVGSNPQVMEDNITKAIGEFFSSEKVHQAVTPDSFRVILRKKETQYG